MIKNTETNSQIAKIKRKITAYYITEPLVFAMGILMVFLLGGAWYALAVLALGICYAAFGLPVSNDIDDQIKLLYPQLYSLRGKPDNRKIRREAKAAGDKQTYFLKTQQMVMFGVCAVCILLLCLTAAAVIS